MFLGFQSLLPKQEPTPPDSARSLQVAGRPDPPAPQHDEAAAEGGGATGPGEGKPLGSAGRTNENEVKEIEVHLQRL